MSAIAHCPECPWHCEATALEPAAVTDVLHALELHLAGRHNWSWPRAHERARQWSQQLLPGLVLHRDDASTSNAAMCPYCDWYSRPLAIEVPEVLRCSSELQQHMILAHNARGEAALVVAERWALPLLRRERD